MIVPSRLFLKPVSDLKSNHIPTSFHQNLLASPQNKPKMIEHFHINGSKKYFEQKVFVKRGEETSQYDITISLDDWDEVTNDGPKANLYYNSALSVTMQRFNFLEREEFIAYQIDLHENPAKWIKRLQMFLYDQAEVMMILAPAYRHYHELITTHLKAMQSEPLAGGMPVSIQWNGTKEEFVEHFGTMIMEKKIKIDPKRGPTLKSVVEKLAVMFHIPKVRGKGSLAVSSLHTLFKEYLADNRTY